MGLARAYEARITSHRAARPLQDPNINALNVWKDDKNQARKPVCFRLPLCASRSGLAVVSISLPKPRLHNRDRGLANAPPPAVLFIRA